MNLHCTSERINGVCIAHPKGCPGDWFAAADGSSQSAVSALNRIAEDRGWVDRDATIRSDSTAFVCPVLKDTTDQTLCYLCESAITALLSPNLKFALRAAFQVYEYAERAWALGERTIGAYYISDLRYLVRQRIEAMISID